MLCHYSHVIIISFNKHKNNETNVCKSTLDRGNNTFLLLYSAFNVDVEKYFATNSEWLKNMKSTHKAIEYCVTYNK